MIRRWVAVTLLAATIVLAGGPATAIPDQNDDGSLIEVCSAEVPTPEMPGRGLAGWSTVGGVEPKTLPPADADPFAENSRYSVYDVYGFAGSTFTTYRDGCTPDDVIAYAFTGLANLSLEMPKFAISLTLAALDAALHPTYLDVFDPLLIEGTTALKEALLDNFVPLMLAIGALWIIASYRRGTVTSAAHAVGWALLVLIGASALFTWPVQAGSAADKIIPATVGTMSANINGGSPGSGLADTALYDVWKRGTFGTVSSPVVDEQAPLIYDGQALTWAEARRVQDNPDKAEALYEEKADQWKEAAETLEDEDPDAYARLIGDNAQNRIGVTAISWVTLLAALPFLVACIILIIGCYLIVRIMVMLSPALATIGVLSPMSGIVIASVTLVGTALLNLVMFSAGMLATLLGIDVLFDPRSGMPPWLAVLLVGVWSLMAWGFLSPVRNLRQLANPRRMVGDGMAAANPARYARKGAETAWGAAKTAAVAGAAGATAGAAAVGTAALLDDDDDDDRSPRTYRHAETYSQPAPVEPVALPAAPVTVAAAPLPAAATVEQPALAAAHDHHPNGSPPPADPDRPAGGGTPAQTAAPDVAATPFPPPPAPDVPTTDDGQRIYYPGEELPSDLPPDPILPDQVDDERVWVVPTYRPEEADDDADTGAEVEHR